MYEPSRHIDTSFIRGFQYHDGALVPDALKPGSRLMLDPEHDNPHNADAFECRVLQIDPKADPWKQVRMGICVTDAR